MSKRFIPGVAGMTPLALLRDPAITFAALKTYIALAAYQAGRETNDPSESALAKYTNLSERSVRRGIEILEQAGWVEVRQRGLRLTNVYRVLVDAESVVDVLSGPDTDGRSGPPDRTRTATHLVLCSLSPLDSSSPEEREDTSSVDDVPVSPGAQPDKPPPGGNSSKQKPAPDPRVKKLIDYFFEAFKKRRGFEPTVNGGVWGNIFKRLLRESSEETIRIVIDSFFAYDKRTRLSIHDFDRSFDNVFGRIYDLQQRRGNAQRASAER